jgi:hypothetical protein
MARRPLLLLLLLAPAPPHDNATSKQNQSVSVSHCKHQAACAPSAKQIRHVQGSIFLKILLLPRFKGQGVPLTLWLLAHAPQGWPEGDSSSKTHPAN